MALGTPVVGSAVYSGIGNALAAVCPSNVDAGDVLVFVVGQKPNTSNTNGGTSTPPEGWTKRIAHLAQGGYGTTNGADVGNTNLWFYTKDVVNGTEGGQTFTTTLTVTTAAFGFIVRVPADGGQISYGTATGQQTAAPGTSLSVALGANPGFEAGDVALWAMTIPTDDVTPGQFSAHTISATGATFNEALELNEPDTTINNDLGGFSAWASVASGTATGAPTIGAAVAGTNTNVRGPVGMLRIREAPPLAGATSTNANTSTSGAVVQTQILAGANSATQAQSTAGAVVQTQLLAGANSTTHATSSSGAVTQTHVLTGAGTQTANQSTSGSVTQTHVLTGAGSESANESTAGAIVQTHVLTGDGSTSQAESTSGAVIQTITLTGADCVSVNESTSGAVSSTLPIDPAQTVALGYRAVSRGGRFVARSAGFNIKPIKGTP